MRDWFIWLLKLQAWLLPFFMAFSGYAAFDAMPGLAGTGLAVMGGLFGFLFGCIGWVMYTGLADLAKTVWGQEEGQKAIKQSLVSIEERLDKIVRTSVNEEAEEAAQLATVVSKISEVKGSIDDLHEGLSDVMEETLKRISGIKEAVAASDKPQT